MGRTHAQIPSDPRRAALTFNGPQSTETATQDFSNMANKQRESKGHDMRTGPTQPQSSLYSHTLFFLLSKWKGKLEEGMTPKCFRASI